MCHLRCQVYKIALQTPGAQDLATADGLPESDMLLQAMLWLQHAFTYYSLVIYQRNVANVSVAAGYVVADLE